MHNEQALKDRLPLLARHEVKGGAREGAEYRWNLTHLDGDRYCVALYINGDGAPYLVVYYAPPESSGTKLHRLEDIGVNVSLNGIDIKSNNMVEVTFVSDGTTMTKTVKLS